MQPNNTSRDVLLALADEVMRLTTARAHATGNALALYTRELANLVDDHRNEFAAALRSPCLDRDGERMRETYAAILCDCLRYDRERGIIIGIADAVNGILAHEEKAGC